MDDAPAIDGLITIPPSQVRKAQTGFYKKVDYDIHLEFKCYSPEQFQEVYRIVEDVWVCKAARDAALQVIQEALGIKSIVIYKGRK